MRSLADDILATLNGATFSIADVTARYPFDESSKTYPMVVLHEIVNLPKGYGTVNGETRTVLSYQLDILTTDCVDTANTVLGRYAANITLRDEILDLLDTTYNFTRGFTGDPEAIAVDVVESKIRGTCVLDSHGYSYRP